MFSNIVVAYDGSDHAERALATACDLAKHYGAKLHLSHTPQLDTPTLMVGPLVGALDTPPSDEDIAKAGAAVIEKAQKAAGNADLDPHIHRGDPSYNIMQLAKEVDADLIVMGRRGLGAVGALALGSVSQSVAHDAKCACMTVV